jgi:hypothetical protein
MGVTSVKTARRRSIFNWILVAGLLAATLDAIAAIVVNGVSAEVVFKYIAGGAFGLKNAFAGGPIMIAYGIFFHVLIAFCWTILYFFLYKRINFLKINPYVSAIFYGAMIWAVMNLVVVPMSKITPGPFEWQGALTSMAIIILMVGLPVSLITSAFYRSKSS